ncbi:pantoate--beta-alanine ligase [Alicyclobacillus acidiphilus]|uniref:pantoate--beta-alanine ligase n=1 Tax=Alicyclobacillus acidiphilus TaxID=182455 RepID=UPI000832F10A|nr:pantoate--beta-alanine ligase [Alicyclobacillus acidiphilus]
MTKTLSQISTIESLRSAVREAKSNGRKVALVPTMGYLHEGHLSLVEEASKQADFVVVSIFVNPLQFGENEDLANYPRDLDHDLRLLSASGHCDVAFTPSVEEMYPVPLVTTVQLPSMASKLCGRTRPIHFAGVATVVTKLFQIVQPDVACFGQKDGQQLAVIRRMVKDLNMPVNVVGVPTVREEDGLAKSSRNVYLSKEEREHAPVLYQALSWAKAEIERGQRDATEIVRGVRERIEQDSIARLDYVEAVEMDTLESVSVLSGDVMIAVAAYFGKARLIDNIQLHVE